MMNFTIETEPEVDGRQIAEVVELPGVMKNGATRAETIDQTEALALRELAERIENGEQLSAHLTISFEDWLVN